MMDMLRRLAGLAFLPMACSGLVGCNWSGQDAVWGLGTGGTGGTGGALPDGGAPTCDADCVEPPEGWSPPALFGVGSFTEVPACPPVAPFPGIEVFSELEAAPMLCPVCQCAASETGCSLPEQWVVSAADCAGAAGAQAISFDAPPAWDGSCWPGGIAAGAQCGGVPCAQSITVGPPEVTAGPCVPEPVGRLYAPPPAWARRARECLPVEEGSCPEEPGRCFPPDGFALCVYRAEDRECPAAYPHKNVFYRAVEDTRSCSSCECGPPEGNACTVLASAFQDGACGVPAGSLLVTSETGDGCVDVPPGLALGGKTAEVVTAAGGKCLPAGGEPAGAVIPSHPMTVCCRRELVPE